MKSPERTERTLPEHHRRLERIFDALIAKAYEGDPLELREEWTLFERELLRHLELEENELFPAFARQHPAEAEALRAEHAQIRAALTELGISLDLHALRAEAVEELVGRLQAHARREDRLFYAWVDKDANARKASAISEDIERLRAAWLGRHRGGKSAHAQ